MTLRKTTSLTTLLSFILLLITSIILYVTPQGKIALWANWEMLGLGKEEWGALHTNLGILFIAAGLLHTVLNWKPITAYMKNKAQQMKVFTGDFNLALGITLFSAVFTIFKWQPVHSIQVLNEHLKNASAEKYGEPPYGHAEASPLRSFCKKTGIDPDAALEKLNAAGLTGISADATVGDIAKNNGMTPQQVYSLIQTPSSSGEMPAEPGSGLGRRTVGEICESYGLDTAAMIEGLKSKGIETDAESKIKEIADATGRDPHDIYGLMFELR